MAALKPRSLKGLRLPIPHSPQRATVPAVHLGTWLSQDGQITRATTQALSLGYRAIDTAAMYGNEREIGVGLKHWIDQNPSQNRRPDVFLTSKVWNTHHHPERVRASIDKTLVDLQTDYVDALLVHWPVDLKPGEPLAPNGMIEREGVTLTETWDAMEEVMRSGKARHIGVSNFTKAQLDLVRSKAKIQPSFLQIELHPYLQRREYIEYAQSKGLVVQAFSPYGNLNETYDKTETPTIRHPTVEAIALRMGISPAQVVLSWNVSRGVNILPKSLRADELAQNLELFELSEDDMALMDAVDLNRRYSQEPKEWSHDWADDAVYPAWTQHLYQRPAAQTMRPSPSPPSTATPKQEQRAPLTAILPPTTHEPTTLA